MDGPSHLFTGNRFGQVVGAAAQDDLAGMAVPYPEPELIARSSINFRVDVESEIAEVSSLEIGDSQQFCQPSLQTGNIQALPQIAVVV